MAFIPVPDTTLGVVRFTLGTEEWSNTFWMHRPNFTPADQDDIADVLDQYWGAAMKPGLAPGAQYLDTTVYDMNTETGRIVINNDGAGVGSGTGEALPVSVAMCFTLYTANRGRTGRGRIYLGGFVEGHLLNGSWTTSIVSSRLNMLLAVQSNAAAAGWTYCVVSRFHNGAPRAAGIPQPIVNIASRSAKATTQRRRSDRP